MTRVGRGAEVTSFAALVLGNAREGSDPSARAEVEVKGDSMAPAGKAPLSIAGRFVGEASPG
jgi:hypothetical protein